MSESTSDKTSEPLDPRVYRDYLRHYACKLGGHVTYSCGAIEKEPASLMLEDQRAAAITLGVTHASKEYASPWNRLEVEDRVRRMLSTERPEDDDNDER